MPRRIVAWFNRDRWSTARASISVPLYQHQVAQAEHFHANREWVKSAAGFVVFNSGLAFRDDAGSVVLL